jgi:hypothetical protein
MVLLRGSDASISYMQARARQERNELKTRAGSLGRAAHEFQAVLEEAAARDAYSWPVVRPRPNRLRLDQPSGRRLNGSLDAGCSAQFLPRVVDVEINRPLG